MIYIYIHHFQKGWLNIWTCAIYSAFAHISKPTCHLPNTTRRLPRVPPHGGRKNNRNPVIQKHIFRWHLRHLLWLAWFPSRKYWIDGMKPPLAPSTGHLCLTFFMIFAKKKHIDGAKKIETGTCAIYNWPGFDTLEAPNLETGRPRAIYSVPLFHIDRFTGISRRVVPSTLPLSQLYLRHLIWNRSIYIWFYMYSVYLPLYIYYLL